MSSSRDLRILFSSISSCLTLWVLEVKVSDLKGFKLGFNYYSMTRKCGVANVVPQRGTRFEACY
ncbi:MAG: hypothetical protein QXQ20_07815 [Candidatus Nezhaarchaeales archaeon]